MFKENKNEERRMGYLDNIADKWSGKSEEDITCYPVIGEKTELRLEVANICNHACLFCPNHKMKRKKRDEEGVSFAVNK